MRFFGWLGMGIVTLTSWGCQGRDVKPTGEATLAQDRAAIDSVRNQYAATWRTGNAAQLADMYAPDGVVLYPNQPAVVGRTAIAAYFKTFFDEFGQDRFELTSDEIQVARPWAFDRGSVRWRGIPRAGGDPVEDRGKYLVILQRQPDGSWKIARDMDNSDQPLARSTP